MEQTLSVRQDVRAELGAGERLLWSGQPRPGMALRPTDVVQIPFSIMWCGFAIFWESLVVKANAPGFFILWGIPFIAVGLYMVAGRFFFEAWQRGHTRYAVTDERVLIVSGGFSRRVKSLGLRLLPEVTLLEQRGTGTITFGSAGTANKWPGMFTGWPACNAAAPYFERIEHAREVYQLVRRAQAEAATVQGA
ncbi:MAG: hypothetical protein JWN73_5179 [Betaproteobacteria bacterium]|nr:hypothetical protein [Betaproteobacteria bacterium]